MFGLGYELRFTQTLMIIRVLHTCMENGENETDETEYVLVSFIERAPRRHKALKLLTSNDLFTPSELAEKMDIARPNVSKVLSELSEKELVNCLNPDASNYRYYEATEKGHEIIKRIGER